MCSRRRGASLGRFPLPAQATEHRAAAIGPICFCACTIRASTTCRLCPTPFFFAGGYAIHGTYETRWLGRPASHGCVRLAPGNAALLFHMVQREGAAISITGSPPAYYAWARRRKTAIYAHVHAKPASMAWHHLHHPALAYAPSRRRAAPVKVWQANPVPKSVQWPAWPW